MGGMKHRVGRLERRVGLSDELLEEARNLIVTEAIRRVSDEDLRIMGDFAKRARHEGEGGVEWAEALKEQHPELWRRFEDLYRETGEEMARGR